VPSEAAAETHATIIRDFATRRALEAEGQAAILAAHDLSIRAGDAIARTVDRIVAASPLAPAKEPTMASGLIEVMDDIEMQARMGSNLIGLPSGLPDLDALTHGWQPGQLVIVAARPSVGKTAFGLHCARYAARDDVPVYFCTQEMPRKQLLRRLIATETRQDLWRITDTARLDMAMPELLRAQKEIVGWPLVIDERSNTPAAIRLAIQRMQAERQQRVGLVVVDYLGKLSAGVRTDRHDLAIGHITGSLCRMGLDFGVPVLLLCQLNRRSEQDGRRRKPTLSDLRDSGNIEQDADVVVALHRDEDAPDWGSPSKTEALVLKNRNGETGLRTLHFDKATGRMTSWTETPMEHRGAA
jgi:replicative DNA helicase